MKKLSTAQAMRYSRHILLSGFDLDTQEKLINSKILVIGVGGVGGGSVASTGAGSAGGASVATAAAALASNARLRTCCLRMALAASTSCPACCRKTVMSSLPGVGAGGAGTVARAGAPDRLRVTGGGRSSAPTSPRSI